MHQSIAAGAKVTALSKFIPENSGGSFHCQAARKDDNRALDIVY
jgi:hypothetical protein